MLCSRTKQVVYLDKTANITVFPLLLRWIRGNKEMTKRLRYTKEILTNMLQPPGESKQVVGDTKLGLSPRVN